MQSLKKIHAWAQMQVPLSITKSISNIFKPNFLWLLTNTEMQNILDMIFVRSPGSCPRGDAGGGGGQNCNFLNMVMWHIKLKEMISRP